MKKIWMGIGVVCAVTMVSCGGSEAPKTADSGTAPATAPAAGGAAAMPDEANGGTITGKVVFDGAKPTAKSIDMSAVPFCMKAHPNGQKAEDVIVNDNGTLKYRSEERRV